MRNKESKFKKFFINIGHSFKDFFNRFKKGTIYTKISYIIMGFGNLSRGQIWKGLIFLLVQVLFILLMITCPTINNTPLGYKAFINLITLGDVKGDIFNPTDNSILMLLYGIVMIALTILFIVIYVKNTSSSYEVDTLIEKGKKPLWGKKIKEENYIPTFKDDIKDLLDGKFHLTMMIPAILGIVVFTVLPTIFMICIAFTNYDSAHPAGQELIDWIGINKFLELFTDKESEIGGMFFPVLGWTAIWAFIATFSCYFLGIFLGLLINKKEIKFKTLWRTIFILTIALPQFISLLAVRNILGNYGPVNELLVNLGLVEERIEFLGSTASGVGYTQTQLTAKASVLLINLWIGIPYTMLQTSGILMNIPKDLYEAATVDGASKWQIFKKITFPYILFITTPYLITSFVGNITSFNIIYLLTGGEPKSPLGFKAGGTDLLVTWLYKLTLDNSEFNLAAVISILTFLITASITLISYSKSKAFKNEEAFQ